MIVEIAKKNAITTVIVLYLLIVFADLWPLSFFGETVHDS